MYDIKEIIYNLLEKEEIKIEEIPNIYLYMDQVLSLFDEKFPYNENEQKLTKTMINNYSKGGIIQPAVKKKYNKEHILMILITCMLKRNLSLSEIKQVVDESVDKVDNLNEKSKKTAKNTDKSVDKNKQIDEKDSSLETDENINKEDAFKQIQENKEKLDIEEIYEKFISKKDIMHEIVNEHLDDMIASLRRDDIIDNENKLLDVLMLCYCSNILSETARAIIRGEDE
ncbi:MAG: DUF1836 domain-containing protein [Peptostreptococcus sp.]|uniref:DUF1836 domain-containing protein n=1 Tax=Peptostreptococcus sp. TaxID=1262 RepID=UPI002FC9CCBD